MKEKIFTPRRIIGIVFIILLFILNNMLSKPKLNVYNSYPENDTEVIEEYCKERYYYIEDFFDKLANNKYEEAYSMLTDKAKEKDFNSLEVFSKYFKDHIIDNNKVQKEIRINLKQSEKSKTNINNYYDVVLSIKPENMAKLNVTFDEILNFYDGRVLNLTVVQTKPYEYKIFMLKPNIPLTKEELKEYIDNN